MIYRPEDDFSKGCQGDRWLNIDTFAIVSHICKFSVVSFMPDDKLTIYMYCGDINSNYISLALKLGLHPSTLAHLSTIAKVINEQWIPIRSFNHLEDYYWQLMIIIWYLHVLWRDRQQIY
jgi:hypothetical protein